MSPLMKTLGYLLAITGLAVILVGVVLINEGKPVGAVAVITGLFDVLMTLPALMYRKKSD